MKALGWGIVICIATALVAHMVRHGPISHDAADAPAVLGLLYDYQTLITGALAVIAAYMTVSEMRRADQNSDDRQSKALFAAAEQHKSSMRLAVRGDRLRVQRALHPQYKELHDLVRDMRQADKVVDEMRNKAFDLSEPGQRWAYSLSDFEVFITSAYPMFLRIQEILQRPQFVDGSQLFDGALTYRISELCRRTDEAVEAGRVFYNYHRNEPDHRTWDDDRAYTHAVAQGHDSVVMRYPSFITSWGEDVLLSMRNTARLYDIREEWVPD